MSSPSTIAEQNFRTSLAAIQSQARALKRRFLDTLARKQAAKVLHAIKNAA